MKKVPSATEVFSRFVPGPAVPYCVELYEKLSFEFHIKKERKSKFGDFRYDPTLAKETITINNNLNPYAFLLTYLHEVAHCITYKKFKNTVDPHGTEWKTEFQKITAPVLLPEIFPPKVLGSLLRYFQNPKASSCSDPRLMEVLMQFDAPTEEILLKHLKKGERFRFEQRLFTYLEKRRTRIVCVETNTGKKYLFSQIAKVKKESEE